MASTMKQWRATGKGGFDDLKFQEDAPIPQLGDKDVLVKFHAASLNYRDILITRGQYPFGHTFPVVPCSDGSGTVESVGKHVTRFKPGDKVVTLFNQGHLAGSLDSQTLATGLGGKVDGVLRQYGAFDEHGLVRMPSNLSFEEAATLSCAPVTAWNALYGLKGSDLKPGDWVLTPGTGGVSMSALQLAKAAGARVIATTSSNEKAGKLKQLGADHVINYKEDANWGETAKKITGGKGVQHVIEVGGPTTMRQSFNAIAIDGVISIIGFLGGAKVENPPSFLDNLNSICITRGVLVGNREQFEAMNRSIEANNIKPVINDKIFKLEEAKEAYQYMADQKHIGKIVISIDGSQESSHKL